MIADEITLKDLEFDFVREKLKEFAHTVNGKEYFDNIIFLNNREDIEREYEFVREAVSAIRDNEDISLNSLTDIRPHLARITKGGVISGTDILTIKDMISLVRQIRSFVRSRREEYPYLYSLAENLDRYDELFSAINRIIDEKGIIRDDCSEKLTNLRFEVRRIRERIIGIIDDYLSKPDTQKMMMDLYYTIRNNRYVLPVKTQFKGSIKGIIHGSSSTGETLFIEPESVINLGNELVFAESLAIKEEENILRDLCGIISKFSENLRRDYEILVRIDVIFAKGRYSLKTEGTGLKIGYEVDIQDIRHPILVIRNLNVVTNSVYLEDGVKGLIISGPNAGGKTVLLKSIGLALLHMKSGLFFPAYEKSRMRLFNRVYTCFGDAQSLEQGLSTFTGHIKRLKYILDNCSEDDLVLLDEIASDTDPKEGSALSASIIESMIKKGAFVFVTTHFHELRIWASGRKDIVNAAMGFDPVLLKPTYKLMIGVSGESYTLRIARDMGIPEEIIENAARLLGDEYREYLEITNLVKLREKELSEKISELEREREERNKEFNMLVEREKADYQSRLEDLNRKRDKIISELEIFYNRISAEITRIQKESDMKLAVNLQKEIRDFINTHSARDNDSGDKGMKSFGIGESVYSGSLKSEGYVIEYDPKKDRYLVNINSKNIWLASKDITKTDSKKKPELNLPSEPLNEVKYKGGVIEYQKEIDVRGLYLDDAISEIEKELDFAYRKSYSRLKIIHGHGTGSLKTGIRKYLRQSIYVSAFRPAELSDGGDGVTIVEIKSD